MHLDFLIVAALKDEAREIEKLLTEPRHESDMIVGRVDRWKGMGSFQVGLIDLFGMGTTNAQQVTQDAIGTHRPRAVLMTGIAAGLADGEFAVQLGDLMVPYGVIPYELAKVRGEKSGFMRFFSPKVEHRGIAWAVADSLWRCAANTAGDSQRPWLKKVTTKRPDHKNTLPSIHASVEGVIGSGDKVVAAEEAEVRRWLLNHYRRQALGLEMESFGALVACRTFDTPFLMAKASVDRATAEKDDGWRTYACQLSAAFLLTVLERYEKPATSLVQRHRDESKKAASGLKDHLPASDFGCRIQTANSFEQLRQKIYHDRDSGIDRLLPTEVVPTIALYGGGGAGKSTIARRLFIQAQDKGIPVLLIDLKLHSRASTARAASGDLEQILLTCSLPRRSVEEIGQLAHYEYITLIIDGANEVSKKVQSDLAVYIDGIQRSGACRVLWVNRVSALDGLPPRCLHATVEKVSVATAAARFDETFGHGTFDRISPRLRSIMQRPFFLDLSIRAKRPFTDKRLWSGIFWEFFREHPSLSEEEINGLAIATKESMTADGRLNGEQLSALVSRPTFQKLDAAQVRVLEHSGDFDHHLWRDYLLSRALTIDSAFWTDNVFDSATTFGTSVECLSMTVEQLPTLDDRTRFIKTVYDWNYPAALECIAFSDPGEEQERQLPTYLRRAVLAVVAEKRFDPILRTARRTHQVLSRYPFAKEFLADESRAAMARRISGVSGDSPWFEQWKQLYVKAENEPVTDAEVELVASEDPLIGWTAANLARRGTLSAKGRSRIRAIYEQLATENNRGSVRWRAVHVLGRWPSKENIASLTVALRDPYHWVQYGAIRSLVEIAARSTDFREEALAALDGFLKDDNAGGVFRPHILEEAVETSFTRDGTPDWSERGATFLDTVVAAEANLERRAMLAERLTTFREALARSK